MTEDVNRRTSRRVSMDLPASIEISGQPLELCRVTNLSEGGAYVVGWFNSSSAAGGKIRVNGSKLPIAFKVIQRDESGLRVSFAHDTASHTAITALLEGAGREAA